MFFLFQREVEDNLDLDVEDGYRFEAYDYGPFSAELYDDLDDLVDRNLIEEEEEEFDRNKVKYRYRITSKGKEIIEAEIEENPKFQEFIEAAKDLKQDLNNTPLDVVIDRVYTKYPNFATKSKY